MAHWLRRFACKLAIKRAAAIPFPEISPITSPSRSQTAVRASHEPPSNKPITCRRCVAVPQGGRAARVLFLVAYADPSVFAGNPLSPLLRRFGLTCIRTLPDWWYLGVRSVRDEGVLPACG